MYCTLPNRQITHPKKEPMLQLQPEQMYSSHGWEIYACIHVAMCTCRSQLFINSRAAMASQGICKVLWGVLGGISFIQTLSHTVASPREL